MKHVIHELTFGDSIKVRILFFCWYKMIYLNRVFDKFQIEKHSVH
jgi:hypothetical protein